MVPGRTGQRMRLSASNPDPSTNCHFAIHFEPATTFFSSQSFVALFVETLWTLWPLCLDAFFLQLSLFPMWPMDALNGTGSGPKKTMLPGVARCCQASPADEQKASARAAKGETSNDGCTKRENSPESRKDHKGKDVAHRKVKERVKLLHELRVSDCSCLCFTTLNQQLDQVHTVHVSRVIAATTGDGET